MNSEDAIASRLLPAGENPFEAGEAMSRQQQLVFEAFDHSPRSRRHYDHVSSLDGLTIMCGHWPQAEVYKCFEDLAEDDDVREAFAEQAHAFLEQNVGEWLGLCHELELDASATDLSNCTLSFVKDALSKTIFDEDWRIRH
jgi:hypothetical protein